MFVPSVNAGRNDGRMSLEKAVFFASFFLVKKFISNIFSSLKTI